MQIDRWQRVEQCAAYLRQQMPFVPRVVLVLGSGLGNFASNFPTATSLPYSQIPGFVQTTVPGHAGQWVFAQVQGVPVAMMCGRFHRYEGYSFDDVVLPVRAMAACGVQNLLLTNAAGGIDTSFAPGDLMLIDDHINLTGDNPLIGPNDDRYGQRFCDMTQLYDRQIAQIAVSAAQQLGIRLQRGVYAGLLGPSYETPAEIRMLRCMGAAAVGMSTVGEAIAARHMGMKVAGISCITNMAAGVLPQPLNHEEVMAVGRQSQQVFAALLQAIISKL